MSKVTLTELQALIELAARAPKSRAETLWLQALVVKINENTKREPDESSPPPRHDTI